MFFASSQRKKMSQPFLTANRCKQEKKIKYFKPNQHLNTGLVIWWHADFSPPQWPFAVLQKKNSQILSTKKYHLSNS